MKDSSDSYPLKQCYPTKKTAIYAADKKNVYINCSSRNLTMEKGQKDAPKTSFVEQIRKDTN